MDWDFGESRCKLLCTEWTNNKVLPYSCMLYSSYRELYSVSCDKPQWKRIWKRKYIHA